MTKKTFCLECYRALPPLKRMALYCRMGDGYEDAYASAVKFLDGVTAAKAVPRDSAPGRETEMEQ